MSEMCPYALHEHPGSLLHAPQEESDDRSADIGHETNPVVLSDVASEEFPPTAVGSRRESEVLTSEGLMVSDKVPP